MEMSIFERDFYAWLFYRSGMWNFTGTETAILKYVFDILKYELNNYCSSFYMLKFIQVVSNFIISVYGHSGVHGF